MKRLPDTQLKIVFSLSSLSESTKQLLSHFQLSSLLLEFIAPVSVIMDFIFLFSFLQVSI